MDEETQKLLSAFRQAQSSGNPETAQRIAGFIRQRSQQQPTPRQTAQDAPAQPQDLQGKLAETGVDFSPAEVRALERARADGNEAQVRNITGRAIGRGSVGSDAQLLSKRIPAGLPGAGASLGGVETLLRGAGQGAFGIGDLLAAGGAGVGQFVSGQKPASFQENLAVQRGRREELGKSFKAEGIVGLGAGALASGGPAAKLAGAGLKATGITGVLSRIPGAGAVKNFFAPGAGKIKRLAQISATGAGGGAVAGGVEGLATGGLEGAKKGAVSGTVAGAIAGPVLAKGAPAIVKATGAVLRRGRAVADPGAAGFEALARRIGKDTDAQTLRQRFVEFEKAFGRKPAISELLDPSVAEELATVVARKREAETVLLGAAEDAAKARQGSLGAIARGTGGKTLVRFAKETQDDLNTAFKKIEDVKVPNSGGLIDILNDELVLSTLGAVPSLRRKALRLGQARADGKPIRDAFTVRELDNLRQNLRSKVSNGLGAEFGPLADRVSAATKRAEPRYGAFLEAVAKRGEFLGSARKGAGGLKQAGGVPLGNKILGSSSADEFADELALASKEAAAGTAAGARSSIAASAEQSARSAARLAKSLAEDKGLGEKLDAALGGSSANTLRKAGALENRAVKSFEALSPNSTVTRASDEAENIREIIQAAAITGKGGGGAFIANFVNSIVDRLRINPETATALAKDAIDPARAADVIARLKSLGVGKKEIRNLYTQAAQAAGITAGVAVGDQQQ